MAWYKALSEMQIFPSSLTVDLASGSYKIGFPWQSLKDPPKDTKMASPAQLSHLWLAALR
jgi:hypothetical protein